VSIQRQIPSFDWIEIAIELTKVQWNAQFFIYPLCRKKQDLSNDKKRNVFRIRVLTAGKPKAVIPV
jgi:hypothetical protein